MRIKRTLRRSYKFFRRNYSNLLPLLLVLWVIRYLKSDWITKIVKANSQWYIPDKDFFKPTLYLKPAKIKRTGIKFFNENRDAILDFRLNGFRYCDALDNAWFYGNVFIYKLNGTVKGVNPIRQNIMDLIDHTAKNISDYMQDRSPFKIENVFI